jgi:molybdate transport system substrate-binding protein
MRQILRVVLSALVSCIAAVPGASAEAVRMFVAGAAKAAVQEIAKDFRAETGHEVDAVFDTVGALRDRVLAGEQPDVVILSAAAIQVLAEKQKLRPEAAFTLGRTGVGLAAQQGRVVPTIGNVDQLRETLLNTSSIAYADPARGATAGTLFQKAIVQLDLADILKDRLRVFPFGVDAIAAVGRGDVEIGISQATEILTQPNVQFIGFLPEPYQAWTPYQAAALTERESVRLFLRALKSVRGAAVLKRVGFE